jgi:ATP-binding cassette subfamily F protein uup
VAGGNDHVSINGRQHHIIGYLQDFLFTPERSRTQVKLISGGERNRLLLARLFTQPTNLLIMDEPTNDLDIETLELLEELLLEFGGTLLLVSHDRAFLNNVVTSNLVLEGEGVVNEYIGGYDDWQTQRRVTKPDRKEKVNHKEGKPHKQSSRSRKLTFNEERELQTLPQHIEALEKEQQQLFEAMANPDFFKQDSGAIAGAKDRLRVVEKELEAAYERWQILEEIKTSRSD